ncbi:MAG: hypothetical protein ACO3CX_07685 [Ilumatobacteraceae bacterium]
MTQNKEELISIQRQDFSEEIYKITFDENDDIVNAVKFSSIVKNDFKDSAVNLACLKVFDKYTTVTKAKVIVAAQALKEKNELLREWQGIETAIKTFNSCSVLNSTLESWSPSSRVG